MNKLIGIVKNGKVELISNCSLPEGTKLLVTPLEDEQIEDDNEWTNISLEGLNNTYGEDEPEYDLKDIQEVNPEYERV
jgi:hypothetical protein